MPSVRTCKATTAFASPCCCPLSFRIALVATSKNGLGILLMILDRAQLGLLYESVSDQAAQEQISDSILSFLNLTFSGNDAVKCLEALLYSIGSFRLTPE